MNPDTTPVIIGAAQLVDREADIDRHIEPLDMLERVARDAARDAGIGAQGLATLDTVALVGIAGWHPDNPANLVAGRLGAQPAHELTTGVGGQVGITLLNHVAEAISEGRSELAFIGGCNNLRVLLKARSEGRRLEWQRGGKGTAQMIGSDDPGTTALEEAYGLRQPPDIYPVFENALRARLGLSLDAHREQMGNLFTRFTRVAAANPHAWFPVERDAAELTTVTPANRMIAFPYPKYLNAILNTEQAAGLIVCSRGRARALGVADDQLIYWLGGAESQESAYWMSERPSFAECPSMRDTQVSTLANAGLDVDQIDAFDFYSCFPVAVEMAADCLDLAVDDPRGFTVTGGLPYAGGPASAYTLHSLAAMTSQLRLQRGRGLVTGNGWYLTKHSAAVISSEEPSTAPVRGLVPELPSTRCDTAPRPVDETATGPARVEGYTVTYDRDGAPAAGIVLGETSAGRRFLANTPADPALLSEWVSREQVGATGNLQQVDGRTRFEPD